jgi:hypothetical protein
MTTHRLLGFVAVMFTACSPLLDVHGGAVGVVDVSGRSVFSIGAPTGTPPGYTGSGRADEVVRRAGVIAARILVSKGCTVRREGLGDLNVEIGAGRREATVAPILPIPLPSGRQAARIEASEREDIAEGALIIDVVNTATQALVWHGAARVVMEPSAIDDALLERATAAILSTFPGCTSSR